MRPALGPPFRMPLYGKHGRRRIGGRNCLDDAVRPHGIDDQPLGQAIDCLKMHAVDCKPVACSVTVKRAVGSNFDLVPKGEHLFKRDIGRRMMPAGKAAIAHIAQRSAQRHIDLLQTSADAEDWLACGDRRANKGLAQAIAPVVDRRLTDQLGAVVVWRDVGIAPSQHHGIEARHDVGDIGLGLIRGHDQRDGPGKPFESLKIAVLDGLGRLTFHLAAAGDDADYWPILEHMRT